MEHLRRLKKVINWLIFKEIAENERALAETLGYTKSSFSQIVTGKVPLSEKFMKRIQGFRTLASDGRGRLL